MKSKKPENLKEILVEEAFKVIEEKGVEKLSLREVARGLGVSHQAPYKHFASRDHILAAVVAKCFERFANHLRARPKGQTPEEDLSNMGAAYLGFAQANPLMYRLMFNTPLPPMQDHPDMLQNGQVAFSLLRDRLETMCLRELSEDVDNPAKHDALFIWSLLHGFTSLMQADAMATVEFSDQDRDASVVRMFRRLNVAIDPTG